MNVDGSWDLVIDSPMGKQRSRTEKSRSKEKRLGVRISRPRPPQRAHQSNI
jgi:hypothetical protein